MDGKKRTLAIVVTGVAVIGGISFWYLSKKIYVPKKESTVETAKTVSESIPNIQTNPGEKVPEVNPLDRANPFKYKNPLR